MNQNECKWMVVRLIGMYCLIQAILTATHLISIYDSVMVFTSMEGADAQTMTFTNFVKESFKRNIFALVAYSLLAIYLLKWGGIVYRVISIPSISKASSDSEQ
ncbi:MAG: hypothetical protein KZQ77_07270 [Candidatus Thiodiazotropha sp. (ex Notomyrtea botanica)]|nr:hypothetical protein [Candidatus Thiodiazotropha sp. (ex Notomyrtea botanica)]